MVENIGSRSECLFFCLSVSVCLSVCLSLSLSLCVRAYGWVDVCASMSSFDELIVS